MGTDEELCPGYAGGGSECTSCSGTSEGGPARDLVGEEGVLSGKIMARSRWCYAAVVLRTRRVFDWTR